MIFALVYKLSDCRGITNILVRIETSKMWASGPRNSAGGWNIMCQIIDRLVGISLYRLSKS